MFLSDILVTDFQTYSGLSFYDFPLNLFPPFFQVFILSLLQLYYFDTTGPSPIPHLVITNFFLCLHFLCYLNVNFQLFFNSKYQYSFHSSCRLHSDYIRMFLPLLLYSSIKTRYKFSFLVTYWNYESCLQHYECLIPVFQLKAKIQERRDSSYHSMSTIFFLFFVFCFCTKSTYDTIYSLSLCLTVRFVEYQQVLVFTHYGLYTFYLS